MKKILLLIFFALISSNLTSQIYLSAETLFYKDKSMQFPENGVGFSNFSSNFNSVGINLGLQVTQKFFIETGLRQKDHFLQWKTDRIVAANLIETSYGVPLRIVYKVPFGKKRLASRINLSVSGGALFDRMNRSSSLPLIRDVWQIVQTRPDGNIVYTAVATFDAKDVNQVKYSTCMDGRVLLDVRVFKSFYVYGGYGYTKGFNDLGKGGYVFTTATSSESGTVTQEGTYKYWVAGLTYKFRKKAASKSNLDGMF